MCTRAEVRCAREKLDKAIDAVIAVFPTPPITLREFYDRTVREEIPPEMLELLAKLR